MERNELIKALKKLKVQTGSLDCLGCGHEHSCGTRGCAVIREAIRQLEQGRFHGPEELPEDNGDVIICFSGIYHNTRFVRATDMGFYSDGAWALSSYLFWRSFTVHGWWYPPEDPERKDENDED